MRIYLEDHHKEHGRKIGHPDPPKYLDVEDTEYYLARELWRKTLNLHFLEDEDEIHKRAIGHLLWQHHIKTKKPSKERIHHVHRVHWHVWVLLATLIVLVLTAVKSHAQFSYPIQTKNGGSNIGFHKSFFIINCGTNTACTDDGTTLNVTASSTAATAFSALTASTNSNAGTFAVSGNNWDFTAAGLLKLRIAAGLITASDGEIGYDTTAKRWHIWNNGADRKLIASTNDGTAGQAFLSNADGTGSFGDPIVSGPDAVAAAPTKNPVQIGCIFLTTPATLTTNQVGAIQCDSTQNLLVKVISAPSTAVTIADGADVTLGAKGDAKNTATDTTAISIMAALKEISFMEQTPASRAVTNAGTFAVQATVADGADTTQGAKADAKNAATDTTAISIMSVLKQISASVQAPPSQAVTNAGTFAVQATLAAETTKVIGTARILGNGGAILDAAGQNVASPANWLATGCQFNTAPTTITTTNSSPIQCDNAGNILVDLKTALPAGSNVIGHVVSDSGSVTAATLSAETTKVIGTARVLGNAGAAFDSATGAAPPANAVLAGALGSGATGGFNTAVPVSDTYKNVNISTATTTLLVTGVSGRQVRIGAIHLVTTLANNVALIEGTGATCGTGTAGMAGGTTAASGWNFAANTGLTLGSGLGTVMQTATTGDSVCVVTSATTQLSGGLQYAIY